MNDWILSRLERAIKISINSLEEYKFSNYTKNLYQFIMNEMCGIYIEASKRCIKDCKVTQHTLFYCLHVIYRLLNPAMPFLTEELFHFLPSNDLLDDDYNVFDLEFPKENSGNCNKELDDEFDKVFQIITKIRSLKNEHKFNPRIRPIVKIPIDKGLADKYKNHIIDLAVISNFEISDKYEILFL